jgi:ribose transport system substrate-binding protein
MAVTAIALLTCALAACGGDDKSDSAGGTSTTAQKTYKMTFIPTNAADSFFVTMGCGAQEAARRLGVDLTIQGPPSQDVTKQIAILNSVIAKHPDAIIISPGDDKALEAPLKQAAAQGIKIVFVGKGEKDNSFVSGFFSTDEFGGGQKAGELMTEITGGRGAVMALGGVPVPSLGVRADGFTDAIRGSGLDYVGNFYDPSFSVDKDVGIASGQLAKHPDMSGIYGLYGQQGENAVQAVRRAGKTGEVHVISFDPTPGVVKSLRDGAVDGIVVQLPGEQGAKGVEQAVRVLDGAAPDPTEQRLGTFVVTSDNVDGEGARYLYKNQC